MSLLDTKYLKINNILKKVLIITSLSVIPLYPTGPFLPDFFLSISSIIFLYLLFKKEISFFFKDKIFYFFIALFIYITLHSFFSINPEVSFKSSFFYFRFYLFALVICYLISEIKEYKFYLYRVLFITIFFVVIDTYIQYFFSQDIFGFKDTTHRLSGPFKDELIVGSFISKTLPLLLSIYFFINKKITPYLVLLCILSFFIIFLSGERVSFFNILTTFIIFLFFYSFNNKKIIIIFLISFIISSLFILLKFDKSRYDRMVRYPACAMNIDYLDLFNCKKTHTAFGAEEKDLSKKDFTFFSKAHEGHFKAGLKMFINAPIFGKGVKMFRYHCGDKKFINEHSCTTHPHNTLIQILAELGILGLFFLVIAIIFCYKNLFKLFFTKKKYISENLRLSLIVINFSLVQIFFIFLPSGQFFNNYLSILYYLPLGIFLNLYYKYINVRK